MGYDEFKSKFISEISRFPYTTAKIPSFKNALDRAVKIELPLRDEQRIFVERSLTNSEALRLSHYSPYLMCKYSESKKSLLVGVMCPAWSYGWWNITKDSFINDQIEYFFHFATQYIHRGYQINVIGAIALTYGKDCDFRGNEYRQSRLPYSNTIYDEFRSNIPVIRSRKNRLFEKYLGMINAFDPFVNRVLYYYVRSLSLRMDEYDEEAMTAADNAIDVIFQAIKKRKNLPSMERKDMYQIVDQEINFPNGVKDKLEDLYQLRCKFTAHPAQSKWWDFYELYERDIDVIMDSVKLTVIKFLMYEANNRIIERTPSCWSEWFIKNCETIYDAVWYHKLPILSH